MMLSASDAFDGDNMFLDDGSMGASSPCDTTIELFPRKEITRICCIGAGYVGGPTCAVIADKCPHIQVTVVDLDAARIEKWATGDVLPIFEPGLDAIVKRCRGVNLHFSTDIAAAIDAAELVFVSVNTPTKTSGMGAGMAADLGHFESACRMILDASKSGGWKVVVEKSTVPCRTAESIQAILSSRIGGAASSVRFEVLSNPEFLAEGTAVRDLLSPDRVLIGGMQTRSGRAAQAALAQVYANWIPPERILTTNLWSSELSKLAANALLAQRISSVNALSAVCEATGADIDEVAKAVGRDRRIGPHFLKASIGFGGSCFQKDILNLVYLSESLHLPQVAAYWHQVYLLNEWQKSRFTKAVVDAMFKTVSGKRIAVLGFAYKKDTGDTRETATLAVVHQLALERARVAIYDPVVEERQIRYDLAMVAQNDAKLFANVEVCRTAYEACANADAIVVCTEWDEFRTLDYAAIYAAMRKPAFVFDGRLIIDRDALARLGFRVHTIGKGIASAETDDGVFY
jgi:UDPglucose 6-dehydrogenase